MKCSNCGINPMLDPLPPEEYRNKDVRATIECGCTAVFANEKFPEFWSD